VVLAESLVAWEACTCRCCPTQLKICQQQLSYSTPTSGDKSAFVLAPPLPAHAADSGKLGTSLFHNLNFALLAVTPVALLAGPPMIKTPLEVGLAIAFPAHAHVSMVRARVSVMWHVH
jgi:hypothetical protein